MRLVAIILLAGVALSQAAENASGRWEGIAQIPGQDLLPIVGIDRQQKIGGIFSTPLVMNGVVYFGSTDGNLYAID